MAINNVSIVNNPYNNSVNILVNGCSPSQYSPLHKFYGKSFYEWSDELFVVIDRVFNGGNYELRFQSRLEEHEIIRKLAQKHSHCVKVDLSKHSDSTSIVERMRLLNGYIIGNKFLKFSTKTCRILFLLTNQRQDWLSTLRKVTKVDSAGCFRVDSKCLLISQYTDETDIDEYDYVFLICDENENVLEDFSGKRKKIFFIILSSKSEFLKINNGNYYYCCYDDIEDVVNTIFKCYMLKPLLDGFVGCISSIKNSNTYFDRALIYRLENIRDVVSFECDNFDVEVGKCKECHIRGGMVSDFEFRYSTSGIFRYDGWCLEGLKSGEAILYVYFKGDNDPCLEKKVQVIARNRVTQLRIEDGNALLLGEGDVMCLRYSYLPDKPDNLSCIEWESADPSIVRVDKVGNIEGIRKGETYVYLSCELVSTKIYIQVLPHVQDINFQDESIVLSKGSELILLPQTVPKEVYEKKIEYRIKDQSIANVILGKVSGYNVGKTSMVVKCGNFEKIFSVDVLTQRKYEQYVKKREIVAENDRGLFSKVKKLFGG